MRKEKKSNRFVPPKRAEKLLLFFLKHDLAEEVLGDLEEKFYATLDKKSPAAARLNYWYQAFNYFRPFALKNISPINSNYYDMHRHYFKIGFRNLLRNKSYALINIGGLAVGMAVAMLIGLWIHFNRPEAQQYSICPRCTCNNCDKIGTKCLGLQRKRHAVCVRHSRRYR